MKYSNVNLSKPESLTLIYDAFMDPLYVTFYSFLLNEVVNLTWFLLFVSRVDSLFIFTFTFLLLLSC